MSYAKFKEFVFSTDPEEMVFNTDRPGLLIVSQVLSVEDYYNDNGIRVHFKGGNFHVWNDNKIIQCPRPGNLIVECEICFSLNNEHGDHIGFLYVPKRKI